MLVVFTLHFLAAVPNAGAHLEYSIEPRRWDIAPYGPVPEVVDGHAAVPDGPGWGVDVNPSWLADADRQITRAD
jgi:L-alanine-DL-glutamate epimerase-like enolase superfamily enzyme